MLLGIKKYIPAIGISLWSFLYTNDDYFFRFILFLGLPLMGQIIFSEIFPNNKDLPLSWIGYSISSKKGLNILYKLNKLTFEFSYKGIIAFLIPVQVIYLFKYLIHFLGSCKSIIIKYHHNNFIKK